MMAQDLKMGRSGADLDLDMDGFGLDSPERCAAGCTFLLEHGTSLLDRKIECFLLVWVSLLTRRSDPRGEEGRVTRPREARPQG